MTAVNWPHLAFKYDHAGRPPILEAVSQSLEFYKNGEHCIGHDLTPRLGKSAVTQISAVEFQAAGAPFVHALTPWTNLAKQLVDPRKIETNFNRVKAEGWAGPFIGQDLGALDSARYWQRKSKKTDPYTLITTTIHLANFNSRVVTTAIELASELYNARPVIIVDEVHLLALGQKWADTLMEFQKAGAFVMTMTGTSSRSDDACILGFKTEALSDWEMNQKTIVMHRGEPYIRDGDGLLVRDITGEHRISQEREIKTTATGKIVPWDEAFARGWMHLVSAQPQDFKVVIDGQPQSMMTIGKTVARQNLGRWMRSQECCRQLANKGIEWLSHLRADHRTRHAKILAVTASDLGVEQESEKLSEKEVNAHAREMRRQLENALGNDPLLAGQELSIEICTSVNEAGDVDEKAAEKLYRFGLTKTDARGLTPIDILIVKGMGIVGLDVPECKILLDNSTIRKGPMKRQLATRVGTIWILEDGSLAPESLIAYPGDPENVEFYNSLTAASQAGKESQLQDAASFANTVEVKPPGPESLIQEGSGVNAGYQDEGGKWASGDYDTLIANIHYTWPESKALRRITLIEMHQNGAFPVSAMKSIEATQSQEAKRKFVNLSDELEFERGSSGDQGFGAKAKRLASRICNYKDNPEKWRHTVTLLQAKAKRKCFISPDEAVDRIQDPEKLRELKAALDAVVVDVLQGGAA